MAQLVIVVGMENDARINSTLTQVARKAYVDTLRKMLSEQDFVEQMKIAFHDINYKYDMMWLDIAERKAMLSASDYELLHNAIFDAFDHEVDEWIAKCKQHGLSEDVIQEIIFWYTRKEV